MEMFQCNHYSLICTVDTDGMVFQQGRIQDLKLGVAQMDWKIWKTRGVYYIFQIRLLLFL